MIRVLAIAVSLVAMPLTAQAQLNTDKLVEGFNEYFNSFRSGGDFTPFGEQIIAQKSPVFNYQCFYNWSLLRDWEAIASGSASRGNAQDCRLPVSTGTTSGSVYRYETVDYGIYDSGFGAESGIAFFPDVQPTGDAVYRVGMGTSVDGAYYEIAADGVDFVIERNDSVISRTDQENFSVDTVDGDNDADNPSGHTLDVYSSGYIFSIYWSWYSVGEVCGKLWTPGGQDDPSMKTIYTHCWNPENITSLANPNLPLFVELDNATTSQNLQGRIGGRRYFILGKREEDPRSVSGIRTSAVSAGTGGLTPVVCARREPSFPTAGDQNTITSAITSSLIDSTGLIKVGYYSVDSITGTWVDPSNAGSDNYADSGSGTEFSVDVSAMTNPVLISKLTFVSGTQNNQDSEMSPIRNAEAKLIRDRPTCLAVQGLTATEDVFAGITVSEIW